MQNQKSDFAQKFLLEFTKQLIENSKSRGIIEIENARLQVHPETFSTKIFTKGKKIETPKEIKDLEKLTPKRKIPLKSMFLPTQKIIPINKPLPKQPTPPQKLTIPGSKLPPQFQNIRPIPTKREIDLGKLNPIIKDPAVNSIECDGPNFPIKIITRGTKKTTGISLTKEEIDTIINTFSTITRIPVLEGIYKVAAGNLILLSVISEVIGTKFVIRKIPQQPQGRLRGPQGIPMQRLPPRQMIQQRVMRK